MSYDSHAGVEGYTVKSLYFDSVYDNDLRAVIQGISNKNKIRIRIYNNNFNKAKLEYKCKWDNVGKKYTLALTREEIEQMIKCEYAFLLKREESFAKEIYIRMVTENYLPKITIQYQRQVQVHPVQHTRITFDRGLRASCNISDFFSTKKNIGYYFQNENVGVLEVKYDSFLMSNIKQALSHIDYLECSNSKYEKARRLFYE